MSRPIQWTLDGSISKINFSQQANFDDILPDSWKWSSTEFYLRTRWNSKVIHEKESEKTKAIVDYLEKVTKVTRAEVKWTLPEVNQIDINH